MIKTEEIVDSIYAAYGTDSGILFGIKEREIVKAIVEFTINRIPQPASQSPSARYREAHKPLSTNQIKQ